TVETVAAGDVVAVQPNLLAFMGEGQVGFVALGVMNGHIRYLVQGGLTAGGAGFHQVAGDLGLTVDHDGLASGQLLKVQPRAADFQGDFDAVVDDPFTLHALARAGFTQQIDRAPLENAGTDTYENIVRGLAFNDDVVDTGLVQQLTQQQSAGAGS